MLSWLRALVRWLADARVLWLCLSVVVVAISVVFWGPWNAERRVRLTGMVLQCCGVATVAWGVRKTRQLFGHASLTSRARAWLGQFPTRGPRVYTATGSGGLTSGGAAVVAFGHVAPRADASLEDRVAAVESDMRELSDRLFRTDHQLDTEVRERSAALAEERHARELEDQRLRTRLEMSATGGLQITAMGVVWLLLGVLLGAASREISFFVR